MNPALNHREIAKIAELIAPRAVGLHVDRLIVPERLRFPDGFLKGEWALRLTGREGEGCLLFSVRPQRVYVSFVAGKGPKAAMTGTRSPFDLAMGKALQGGKIRGLRAWEDERILSLDIDSGGEELTLVLLLIPAHPEALLLRRKDRAILSRSKLNRGAEALESTESVWSPPERAANPPASAMKPALLREGCFDSLASLHRRIEDELDSEAFERRRTETERRARELLKQSRSRLKDSLRARDEAAAEPDWRRYGELLKAHLASPPPLQKDGKKAFREVLDYGSGEAVRIPCDPQLDARAQAERFFSHGRRKERRQTEAAARARGFEEAVLRFEGILERLKSGTAQDWPALAEAERAVGLVPAEQTAAANTGGKTKPGKIASTWLGKRFTSKDGSTLLVGRTRDENLELTFKVARGNDLWMHVRGKPGAHVVIPLHSGKSASLETLLDAAHLCIYYSKGESWGKTEVDYAFKKHVKRIKDSKEVSYTGNKTLIVSLEPERLKRLLAQESST